MDACTEPEIAPQPFYLNLVVVDSSAAVDIALALANGFRGIDTALGYLDQPNVSRALKAYNGAAAPRPHAGEDHDEEA